MQERAAHAQCRHAQRDGQEPVAPPGTARRSRGDCPFGIERGEAQHRAQQQGDADQGRLETGGRRKGGERPAVDEGQTRRDQREQQNPRQRPV